MNIKMTIFAFVLSIIVGSSSSAYAQINADYSAVPIPSEDYDPPQIMLSMSRDHQYFFKAYNDYTDLDPEDASDVDADGNPVVETTYKHSFDYFGYFDSGKCYTYVGGQFNPVSITANKYCSAGQWAGNFLNWATMTRMDIVRKIFYGGKRSTDSATDTVLERAYLPSDAHSFAKYYNGPDLAQLTPYGAVRTDTTNFGDNDGFDDQNEGITFCNTSYSTLYSHSQVSLAPPLIRVAEGNFQLWASNERWQCTWDNERGGNGNSNIPIDSGIDASDSDPAPGDEYIARVSVCVSDALIGGEDCKSYPNGNLKPTGLLQTYGDGGLINFGLMTGSYNNNVRGGVLRKNAAPFLNEVDVLGDGTFTFTTTSESIVRTLDSLRPWGYQYGDGTYIGGGMTDACGFGLTNIPNGRCKSWGNPISEIYKETIRYIAGLNATPTFTADDSGLIAGLRTAVWNNPQNADTQCAGLNTIVVNASVSSYDDDETAITGVAGGINGTSTVAAAGDTNTWTNKVGDASNEDLYTGTYFIGETGTDNNQVCDGKSITALSTTFGLCPEAPTVNGSFAMAGIAYYAHNNDIRADLDGNQTVNTFAISLATNSPVIRVPRTDGGQAVEILPAFRLLRGTEGGGALVDFKIVQPHTRIGPNQFAARYYVNWEDSEQGGDYDQDLWGLIDYVLDESTNEITITTNAAAKSTPYEALFGFVTSGTSQDGFHAYSGINGANYADPLDGPTSPMPGCSNCTVSSAGGGQKGPQSHTFDIAPSTTKSLESPLFYAAKYGGFKEEDDIAGQAPLVASPDKVSEWDSLNNNTGAVGPDGIPDNYFFVINPEELLNSLNNALAKILSQTASSATSVANFANADGFANLVTQAFFKESTLDENVSEVTWTGDLISYFIDDFGIFREDTNGNGQLDLYSVDKPFAFDFDLNDPSDPSDDIVQLVYPAVSFSGGDLEFDADGLPKLSRDMTTGELTGTNAEISSLKTVWNAGESLQGLDNATIRVQRNYSTAVPATTGSSRYIFTFMDQDLDGVVDIGEQTDFVSGSITNANFGLFGVGSEAIASDVVDYVRGYEDPAGTFRSRTLLIDGNDVVYRLGDIVNSSPKIVGNPTQAYDTIYGDTSYTAFRELYENRRHMVYIGANDGLLHAFNVGFKEEVKLDDNNFSVKYGPDLSFLSPAPTVAQHPLGAEVWAYAPSNLLPHLQWLTSGFYTHVFYVDGVPESYEAKIFTPDAVHPNGWGTILVIGMRLGGGDFPITLADGSTSTTQSAYIILDITDPESPPELMAEITHPNMNFTTAKPTLHYECGVNCDNASKSDDFNGTWKLVFGSGPNNLQTFKTNETAKVFTYDLETKALLEKEVTGPGTTTVANSFVGGMISRDWDNGKTGSRDDEVVYFGTVGQRSLGATLGDIETGGVYRVMPQDSNATSLLYDADRPVSDRPLALANEQVGNFVEGSWVYFGTGQYAHESDETTFSQERFYGIREPVDTTAVASLDSATFDASRQNSELLTYATVSETDLLDTTSVQVRNNDDGSLGATVQTGDLVTSIAGATTFEELKTHIIDNTLGWYRDLPLASGALPSARVFSEATSLKTQLFFTSFKPDSPDPLNICIGGLGETDLYALNLTTGTASDFGALGIIGGGTAGTNASSINIGLGSAGTPLVFTSEALGGNKARIITQKSNIESKNTGVTSGKSQFLRTGWREIR